MLESRKKANAMLGDSLSDHFMPKVDLLEDPVLISEVMFQRVICLASQHSLIPILGMPELTTH